MEDNSENCIKINDSFEEISKLICINCIYFDSLNNICGYNGDE